MSELWNGFVSIDLLSLGAPDINVIHTFDRYVIGAELQVVGLPIDIVNTLDNIAGVSLDLKQIEEVSNGKEKRKKKTDAKGEDRERKKSGVRRQKSGEKAQTASAG